MSVISSEAIALIERVEKARAAFQADGLSRAAADVLIALDFWQPLALLSQPWCDGPERAGLATRIAKSSVCTKSVVDELERYCHDFDWPD